MWRTRSALRAGLHVLGTAHVEEEILMDKWTVIRNSNVARIGASAATIVTVAAVVGAGFGGSS